MCPEKYYGAKCEYKFGCTNCVKNYCGINNFCFRCESGFYGPSCLLQNCDSGSKCKQGKAAIGDVACCCDGNTFSRNHIHKIVLEKCWNIFDLEKSFNV
ncbi:hypothetical protein HZS_1704 [Henneguya salminicola]|nr:hypothetical protein HZS_1704 [Henneguya salminicola]